VWLTGRLMPDFGGVYGDEGWLQDQFAAALGALDRALRLNPSYSHLQVAAILMFAGELERTGESIQKCQAYGARIT
jgi:hypothetical protein